MRATTIILPVVVIALAALLSSIFIVDERQKALVLQFGQIKRVKEDPGIAFKLPLIQNVVRYDDRILSLDTDPIEVTPADDRRLIVDAFARYRIASVVDFREAVGAGGVMDAERRLANILNAQIRAVLGSEGVTSNTILSEERGALMARIRDEARERAAALGIEVIDVRLKQTNLPDQNLEATFGRMRAEREREAADEIARGEEAAQRVRALADRTVVELVSEARRESEIVRGEADAQRNNIFADAFTRDEEFFRFYRSLAAYRAALQEGNSAMVLSPDAEFFQYLRSDRAAVPIGPAPAGQGAGAAPQPQAGAARGGGTSGGDDAASAEGEQAGSPTAASAEPSELTLTE
ncbi:protease modulator HflC [Roseitranquillus sediminis]|uniref:protease modulator HflC n=1 Tax=Roseitranquillus sediminis TaxID=2809051 RepID=UPI001D0C90D8|nr:protease modulator HflC [Roseitranquillus sediminis]MBM9596454.1 protease modulator HflC [Roseitranquillus sediminis]